MVLPSIDKGMYKKGLYIVIEGIDGSGKSTLAKKLYHYFEYYLKGRVVLTKEPTDGPIGTMIRERAESGNPLSLEEQIDLFIEDRKEHMKNIVLPALEKNKIIIQDRSFISNVIYQANDKITIEDILEMNSFAEMPDFVLFLDLSPEKALSRISKRKGQENQFESLSSLKRVYENYQKVEDHIVGRVAESIRVDADTDEKTLFNNVVQKINSLSEFFYGLEARQTN